jgi:hypothetical protein
MKKLSFILLLIIASIAIVGCNDEDNEDTIVKTKTDLLCKKWKFEKIFLNDLEQANLLNMLGNVIVEYKKNGDFSFVNGSEILTKGTWKFNSDETR